MTKDIVVENLPSGPGTVIEISADPNGDALVCLEHDGVCHYERIGMAKLEKAGLAENNRHFFWTGVDLNKVLEADFVGNEGSLAKLQDAIKRFFEKRRERSA